MKAKGLHENCIQQMDRLYRDFVFNPSDQPPKTDDQGRLRLDDWEMAADIQEQVNEIWPKINTGNINQFSDFEGYKKEFLKLFGFGFKGVDYDADVDHNRQF